MGRTGKLWKTVQSVSVLCIFYEHDCFFGREAVAEYRVCRNYLSAAEWDDFSEIQKIESDNHLPASLYELGCDSFRIQSAVIPVKQRTD